MPNWATHLAVAIGLIVVGVGAVVLAALTDASPWLALPGTVALTAGLVGLFVAMTGCKPQPQNNRTVMMLDAERPTSAV